MGQQLLRNYRQIGPTAFHAFNQRVATALADKTRIPDSVWAGSPGLLQSYLAASAKHDAVYHESMLGSKLVIAEREVLQAQLVIQLDEIALWKCPGLVNSQLSGKAELVYLVRGPVPQ